MSMSIDSIAEVAVEAGETAKPGETDKKEEPGGAKRGNFWLLLFFTVKCII